MEFGVEDRESQCVTGEPVAILVWDAGDEPVDSQSSQIVAGLVDGVVRAAEQSGHQGTQALVGDAGDGEHAGA